MDKPKETKEKLFEFKYTREELIAEATELEGDEELNLYFRMMKKLNRYQELLKALENSKE